MIKTKTQRILHYPGSKWRTADWIINHFPEHETYCEPFFGSGAVLFTKERSTIETINDLDRDITNFFKVIRERPEELAYAIKFTPHSRQEYYLSYEKCTDELERARRTVVRLWQGRGGKTSHRTGWRSMIENNGPLPGKEWLRFPDKIASVSERLQGVQIENQCAIQLVDRYNKKGVLIYADPPYVLSTRTTSSYKHEMTDKQHADLLNALDSHKGFVVLSGYANDLYDTRLQHWSRFTKGAVAEAGAKREEVLWINPATTAQLKQQQLSLF